jgi:dihydroorotase
MSHLFFSNARLVNEGRVVNGSLEVKQGKIEAIHPNETPVPQGAKRIDCKGKFLLPGLIDDQVHFREPGLTHKGSIRTESAAAAAGGITSYMEMPNVSPPTLNNERLKEKLAIAAKDSAVNYAFYLGASNDNLQDVLDADSSLYCGLKIFMGSSTGNMLVDNQEVLRELFSNFKGRIALHCEDEGGIRARSAEYRARYGENVPVSAHPDIRNHEICYLSSSKAVELAQQTGGKIHVLHLSTARECSLFQPGPVEGKQITSEACVHHLWFSREDYDRKGSFIKWNPAVKDIADREAIWQALHDGRIDIVATDHAPHTLNEKQQPYFSCPSGGPLVQHALPVLAECVLKGWWDLPMLVEKMCHNPAKLFNVLNRGFLKPGYYADLVLLDMDTEWTVTRESLLYSCGWSPFEGETLHCKVAGTWVNGVQVWDGERVDATVRGEKLIFDKK